MARRHVKFTLKGRDGRIFRIGLGVLCGMFALVLVLVIFRDEPQYMGSPEISQIEKRGVLRVGVRDDMPGFGQDGEGLEIELATLLAQRILPDKAYGSGIEFVPVNLKSVGPKLDDGSIDVAVCLMRIDAYPSKYAYSSSYYTDPCYFLVTSGNEAMDLQGKVIGAVNDTYAATRLKSYVDKRSTADDPYATIKYYASYPEMLMALGKGPIASGGQIDAAALQDSYVRRYRDAYAFSIHQEPLGSVDYAFASSIDSPAIAGMANLMLREMKKDGSLQALLEKYGLG